MNCFKIFSHFLESPNVLQDESSDSLVSPRSATSNSTSSWIGNEKRRRQQYMAQIFAKEGAIAVITGKQK